jgi:phosphatidylinositol 4-phosphatase
MGKGKVLRIYDSHAVFENLDDKDNSYLVISQDNGTRKIEKLTTREGFREMGANPQTIPFEAIFGFYDLLSGSYVALVVESEPYVSYKYLSQDINIRKAKKFMILPLFRQARPLSEVKQTDEDRYLKLLNLGFEEHSFFFSYTYDITHTQQRLAKMQFKPSINSSSSSSSITNPGELGERADKRFFWNRQLISDLITNNCHNWIIPFMSAYIELRSDIPLEDNQSITLLFISRRSCYRQGCRFTRRGVDKDGNVANFVETEQILFHADGKISSYVQIRGSIPVCWSSPVHMKYEPMVWIESDEKKSETYAYKHFAECMMEYSGDPSHQHLQQQQQQFANNNLSNSTSVITTTILLINLIDNKKDQGRLGREYKNIIDRVSVKMPSVVKLHYEWFDFHHETKQKGKWNNLSKLIINPAILESFDAIKYFSKDKQGNVLSWQRGVIRTNCMDNLDRTNVVQSLFARRALVYQVGLNTRLEMKGQHILQTPWKNFEIVFKTMWANNANAISMGYAGTGALKIDFTKTGKRTFKGMINDGINSVKRYYINNFTDGAKQDAIDLLIGNYKPDYQRAPAEYTTPFTHRTSQEAMAKNATKIFVLIVIVFLTLLLLLPPLTPFAPSSTEFDIIERNLKHLQMNFALSMVIGLLLLAYSMYKIGVKGSKVGELMVLRPELVKDEPVKQN